MSDETLFNAALEQPTDQRAEFLAVACGNDQEQRQRVEALLAAHHPGDSFLEPPPERNGVTGEFVAGAATDTTSRSSLEQPGSRIGPYRLLQQIGEGGMGVVFMAEQEHPIRRRVALKIVKPGLDTSQVLARFEAERQALALMNHQNIAQVFDVGATQLGRPFFVMELINGVPITQFCDQERLSPRERLELFVPVCQAVQHAHQKGIIHRDLKPSNVLVALYDARPVAKIIDFGVAKAMNQRLTERTMFTEFGQVIGTLEYMSPEQAERNALDIDTRSDIYSLGALLYELLTGATPLDRKKLQAAGFLEMLRLIREEEPAKPSTRLSQSGDALPSISAQRHSEPAGLSKILRGELDWIVMKCLEKERGRRYQTANGLVNDVQRYLAGEPVLAAPSSRMYKLRKFVRRNRVPVATAALILFALVAAVLGTTWGLLRAEQQRQIAEEERDAKAKALVAEQKARENALTALRDVTDEIVQNQMARNTTLTEESKGLLRKLIVLFEGITTISADDIEGRSIRAEGQFRVGMMQHRLGEWREAESAYRAARDLRKRLADESPERSEFQHGLAECHNNLGILFDRTGRTKEAESAFREALALRKQLAADHPQRSEFLQALATNGHNLGVLVAANGRLAEAEELYRESLSTQRRLAAEFPNRHDLRGELAKCLVSLGSLLRRTHRMLQAEEAYREALAIRKQLVVDFPTRPEFRQDLARCHNDLGILLHDAGRLREAEQASREALALQMQLAADFPSRPEFRQELARSHNNMALLMRADGRPQDAEAAHREALSLRKRLTTDFPMQSEYRSELTASYNNLGVLLKNAGRLDEADAAYREALSLRKQLVADFPNQPDLRNQLAGTCLNLAGLCNLRDEFAAAQSFFDEAKPHHIAALKSNPNNPTYRQYYRQSLWHLAGSHAGRMRPADAQRTAEKIRDLNWDAPIDAYTAACALAQCIPIISRLKELDENQRQSAIQSYGAAALSMLKDAVSKGFKNVAKAKKDIDLEPLRQREDFKSLIAELQSTIPGSGDKP